MVGEGEGGPDWDSNIETYTITICKRYSQWEFSVWPKEFNPVLCDNLEGRGGVRGGSWGQEVGTYVWGHMYAYSWFMWMYNFQNFKLDQQYNIVKQLSLN